MNNNLPSLHDVLVRARSQSVRIIKIGKVEGVTKAKAIRDLCVALGIAVTIDDIPGGDITGATILHLAHSTLERYRHAVTSSYQKVSERIADGGPVVTNRRATSNTGPGLGVSPYTEVLRKPLLEFRAE